jgi:hypothetical protein
MIHARSPYYFSLAAATSTWASVELELYIYTGTSEATGAGSQPATATVVLKAPLIDHDGNGTGEVHIDISPYCLDQMKRTVRADTGSITNENGIWVDWRHRLVNAAGAPGAWSSFTYSAAVPGWITIEEGKNYTGDISSNPENRMMITRGGTMYYPVEANQNFYIPFDDFDYGAATVPFYKWNGTTRTTIPTTLDNAINISTLISYVEVDPDVTTPDTIEIQAGDGGAGFITMFKVAPIDLRGRDLYKVFFINKWGAIQTMWFFGRADRTLNTTGQTFQRTNLESDGTIDAKTHKKKKYFVNGRENITLNSWWQTENNNPWFKELFLSEDIWIRLPGDATPTPVNIVSTSFQEKTQRWDKMINYTIEFEFSSNYMQ